MEGVLEDVNFQTTVASLAANRADYEATLAENKSRLTDVSREIIPGARILSPG